jgi:hypothetical protein
MQLFKTRIQLLLLSGSALGLFGLIGCGQAPSNTPVEGKVEKGLPAPIVAKDPFTIPLKKATSVEEVTLDVIKYAQFGDALVKYKGKVIVCDIWAEY